MAARFAASILAIASQCLCTGTAYSGALLQVDGRLLRWEVGASRARLLISYAILSGPFFVPASKKVLSPSNCASMDAFGGIIANSPGFNEAATRKELGEAFASWERSANIAFVETADAYAANIVVGAQAIPEGKAFANLSYRGGEARPPVTKALGSVTSAPSTITNLDDGSEAVAAIDQAYICLNPKQRWKIGFDGNLAVYDLRYTFTHEIGHALGLDHPNGETAMMAYRYDERVSTLQTSDIAAVQRLYGPPRD